MLFDPRNCSSRAFEFLIITQLDPNTNCFWLPVNEILFEFIVKLVLAVVFVRSVLFDPRRNEPFDVSTSKLQLAVNVMPFDDMANKLYAVVTVKFEPFIATLFEPRNRLEYLPFKEI